MVRLAIHAGNLVDQSISSHQSRATLARVDALATQQVSLGEENSDNAMELKRTSFDFDIYFVFLGDACFADPLVEESIAARSGNEFGEEIDNNRISTQDKKGL